MSFKRYFTLREFVKVVSEAAKGKGVIHPRRCLRRGGVFFINDTKEGSYTNGTMSHGNSIVSRDLTQFVATINEKVKEGHYVHWSLATTSGGMFRVPFVPADAPADLSAKAVKESVDKALAPPPPPVVDTPPPAKPEFTLGEPDFDEWYQAVKYAKEVFVSEGGGNRQTKEMKQAKLDLEEYARGFGYEVDKRKPIDKSFASWRSKWNAELLKHKKAVTEWEEKYGPEDNEG